MIATTATSPGGVEYFFHCQTPGGHDSAWQASPIYQDVGLSPGTSYTYEVMAENASSTVSKGRYSTAATATTQQRNHRLR